MTEKTYRIQVTGKHDKVVEGTLEYLKQYFSYTLLLGNQQNPKIKKEPENIKQLLTALQKSYSEIEAACYNKTYVDMAE
jgi:hypothetical protein